MRPYYVHTDQLGTPQVLTDETGTVVWRATYDPFGKATVYFGSSVEMNVRMPGQYFDAETGLHQNGYRDYDPGSGRYIESDPIGLNGGLNTFAYVSGNPLRHTDFYGLAVTCEWVATGYYDKITQVLIQPEKAYLREVCFPAPAPSIGIPDPVPGKRPGFPNPLDISFERKCVREWIITQQAKYKQNVEKWMSGYMKCTDSCTGAVTNNWSSDRPANNPPKVN